MNTIDAIVEILLQYKRDVDAALERGEPIYEADYAARIRELIVDTRGVRSNTARLGV